MDSYELYRIYLMVENIDRSLGFYHDKLGFNLKDRNDSSAKLEAGNCDIKLEEDFNEETLNEFGLTSPGERRGDGFIANIWVDDVEDIYQDVDFEEEEILSEPKEVGWSDKMFLVRDPDGYVLEMSERPED